MRATVRFDVPCRVLLCESPKLVKMRSRGGAGATISESANAHLEMRWTGVGEIDSA